MIRRETKLANVLIVGGGPAGLAMVANLLKYTKVSNIIWIDPKFNGGRLELFPNVPSNTKTSLFVRYGENCDLPGELLVKSIETLKSYPQDNGCELLLAGEMVKELTLLFSQVYKGRLECIQASCIKVVRMEEGTWKVLSSNSNDDGQVFEVEKVIFATGSEPRPAPSNLPFFSGKLIDPEILLCPPRMLKEVNSNDTIGIVGNSHSAILMLKNLTELPISNRPKKIYNFYRKNLKYAEYLSDGRIKYDNTGLKGEAANWARQNLFDSDYESTCLNGLIVRFRLPSGSGLGANSNDKIDYTDYQVYQEILPTCTKLTWAIGYVKSELPIILDKMGTRLHVKDYDDQGRLLTDESLIIKDLYGIGIAFPQRVIDPSGDVEEAVGLWKFMKTANHIVANHQWSFSID